MRALITGGGGFLGGALARRLVADGRQVRTLQRGDYPWHACLGIEAHRGDIADARAVSEAVEGSDVVFHVAAKAGAWGSYASYYAANVTGTRHVIAACLEHGVPRIVHTSSPSVVHAGADQEGVGPDAPYPERFLAHYPATKAEAEQDVLAANGPDLATVALRPHLVWGPHDNHLVPRILARGRAGKLRRIGPATTQVDATYIDNAVDAHVAAAERLAPDAACAGKAYFVANDEPVHVFDLVDRILAAGGLPPVRRSLPAGVAYAAGALCEAVYSLLGRDEEPPVTRFVANQLSTSHWYDLGPTRRDLGWRPRVSTAEGLGRLAAWLAAGSPQP